MIKLVLALLGTLIVGMSSCAGADLEPEPSDPPAKVDDQNLDVQTSETSQTINNDKDGPDITNHADTSPVEISHAETDHSENGHAGDDPHHKNSPRPYDASADAWADLNAILAAAKQSEKPAIIVMGANWCHDSRALAFHFENEDFRAEQITPYFEQLYIDVGEKNRNIDIAQHFGLEAIVGTPTIFVVSPNGDVQNLETAPTWRNAASRSKDEIIEYFKSYR